MRRSLLALAGLITASDVSAQLLLPKLHQRLRASQYQPVFQHALQDASQIPLGRLQENEDERLSSLDSDLLEFKAGRFTRHEQDNATCATYGEKQWAGTVDISDERRIFYWYFDSRNDPENDPLIIWINGGPGASSMTGLFVELGPCVLLQNQTVTTPNPYAWNNNASVVFIDQPAGVGFSDIKPGTPYATSDREAAKDLQTFLRIFFDDVFPSKKHLPIHFAGESYGGHYVPVTMSYILESRKMKSVDAFWGNITSLVLVNSLIENIQWPKGLYELMCTEYRGKLWNETQCRNAAWALPEMESLARLCELSRDGRECLASNFITEVVYYGPTMEGIESGKRSMYNIQLPCVNGPYCFPENRGNFTAYLNQPQVLKALGFPSSYIYDWADEGAGMAIALSYDGMVPTSPHLTSILDFNREVTFPSRGPFGYTGHDAIEDTGAQHIRVLVLNGNEDTLVNSPGQKWVFEKLPWSGAAGYRAAKWREWEELGLGEKVGEGGEWKMSESGQLVFVAVDRAGHMVPLDQGEVASKVINKWMSGFQV